MVVFDGFDSPLHVERLENVKNVADLKDSINNGEIDGALLRADFIPDPFLVVVAGHKAQQSKIKGKLVTKSIYTEIIYNLSPSKNITQSLKTFGVNENDTTVVVAHFGTEKSLTDLLDKIKFDRRSSPDDWTTGANLKEIQKVYKIDSEELKATDLVEAVASRIAVKGLL